jgi:NADH-quinone oxidoreductase subunit I
MINYFKEIFGGLWTLFVGMRVTARYAASPTITTHYPFDTIDITPNYRGHTDLVINEKTGKDKCIVCMMCERTCPSQCITVIGEKPEGSKKKVLTEYYLDFTKCSLCGNCVEVCPTSALEYSQDYNLAGYSRHDFHFDLVNRFRDKARALGVEPNIGDLAPVEKKPAPQDDATESEETPHESIEKAAASGETDPAKGEEDSRGDRNDR